MTTADIMDVVGGSRAVGCVVEMAAEIFTPELAKRYTPAERAWFGPEDGSVAAGKLTEVEAVVCRVGKVTVLADILAGKWIRSSSTQCSWAFSVRSGCRSALPRPCQAHAN
jgi:2-dehydropantoate 2-reductase